MFYHLQPTRLTLRLYANENGFENRDEFIGTAQVDLRSDGEAYVHAMRNDARITRNVLRQVVNELTCKYGVKRIKWEHSNKDQELETKPADLI